MKVKFLYVLMVAIFVIATAGCAASTPAAIQTEAPVVPTEVVAQDTQPSEPVEIIMALNGTEDSTAGWKAAVEEANKQLAAENIVIRVQLTATNAWPDYYAKITSQMAADQSPDIGIIPQAWFPTLIKNAQVQDLTGFINSELDMTQFYEQPFKNTSYVDNKYYGIPASVYYLALFYNKDMFDKAGLPYPSADWNNASSFDEIREMAKHFVSGEGIEKSYGFFQGPYLAYIGAYSQTNGGNNVFNPDGTCALASPESLDVYKWFDEMIHTDGSMPEDVPATSVPAVISPSDLFANGKLAMLVDGSWNMYTVLGITDFKVGVAALPAGSSKEALSTHFIDNWVIWSGTKHPEEAAKALKALLSPEVFAVTAEKGVAGMPLYRPAAEAFVNNVLGQVFTPEDITSFLAASDHYSTAPYNSFYEQVDQLANNSMDQWLLGQITYEQYAQNNCKNIVDASE